MEVFLATFSALFSVVNPFGAIVIFLSLTQDYDRKVRNDMALKTAVYMTFILIGFFFAGELILDFFGIRIEHIRMAGGLIIAISGFSLLGINAHKGKPVSKSVKQEGINKEDISFTPMAMPIMSGPGAIAIMIGMFENYRGQGIMAYLYIVLAVIAVAIISFLILRSSRKLNKWLGKGGMAALTRMMGFIILSIGIGMIMNGVVPLIGSV